MIFLFANFVDTTLALPLDQSASSAWVPQSASELYPQPTGTEVIAVTIQDGYQAPEIVYVTENAWTGEMVILRGREGTTAKSWPAGSLFIHTLTKASILWFSSGGATDLIAALQAQVDAQAAALAQANADILALKSYVDGKDADLEDSIEQANASITTNAQVIADTNYALAQLDINLSAQVSSNSANISVIYTTIATNQGAQSTINTTLNSRINGVESNLTIYQNAQADINGALSESIETLTASYGDQQAEITETATAIATINGNLSGKYTVAISAGAFASLELAAGSGTSSYSYFALRIQDFYIKDPTGTYTPFYFNTSTATAYLQNVYITNAVIENLTILNSKIGYNEITDRMVANSGAIYNLLVGSRTEVIAFYYGSAGGAIEAEFSLTLETTGTGPAYPQVYIVCNGVDALGVPWYIDGQRFDARELSTDISLGPGLYRFSLDIELAALSDACRTRRIRLKVTEYMR